MIRTLAPASVALAVTSGAVVVLLARASSGAGSAPVALPLPTVDVSVAAARTEETAVFAGGCFWGIEAVFEHLKGVTLAESGYAGGSLANPSYEQVSSGRTGHAESVRIVYDPSQISYGTLLRVFFSVAHDPTQLNRQGPDVGTQYRSAIFYLNEEQKQTAEAYIDQLTKAKAFSRPMVTQLLPLRAFYVAEPYHQDYMAHHPYAPYIIFNDAPKIEHLRSKFPELYRELR